MNELNLIAPKGQFTFGRLVFDSFVKAGHKVNWWDWRKERDPFQRLNMEVPTLVLRGNDFDAIPRVLEHLKGPRFLWYAEDCCRDGADELLKLSAYYDDIWLHWPDMEAIAKIQNLYGRKVVKHVPVLYADQRYWKPLTLKPEDPNQYAYHCEVLHYGATTPRREAILGDMGRFSDLVIYREYNEDHGQMARSVCRAKVVLNLHAWTDINVEIRLAEALSCGAFVVSEALPKSGVEKGLSDLIWNVPPNNVHAVLDTVRTILKDFPKLRRERVPAIMEYVKRFNHLNIAKDIGPYVFSE